MKAIFNTKYGNEEILSQKEIPKLSQKSNEVPIQINTTTVNRTDIGFRNSKPLVVHSSTTF